MEILFFKLEWLPILTALCVVLVHKIRQEAEYYEPERVAVQMVSVWLGPRRGRRAWRAGL